MRTRCYWLQTSRRFCNVLHKQPTRAIWRNSHSPRVHSTGRSVTLSSATCWRKWESATDLKQDHFNRTLSVRLHYLVKYNRWNIIAKLWHKPCNTATPGYFQCLQNQEAYNLAYVYALESWIKLNAIGTNTRTETFAPLIYCVIDHALLQATQRT